MKDLVAQPLGCKLHLSKTLVSVFEARIGAPNLGGVGFSEQSQYWCVPAGRLKEMFAGKKGASNNSSAYNGALKGLKSRNLLQMNGGLVWMPTEDGKCQRAERSL